jgi:acetyl-CoA acyltransferase
MNEAREAVVIAYGRTPLARAYKGGFAETHPVEFGAQALKGMLQKTKLDASLIEDVMVGCAMPERYTGYNIARLLAQYAGLPDSVPGQTINRLCASGLQAIVTAANAIMAGQIDVAVAGGIELMTGIAMEHPAEYRHKPLDMQLPGAYMTMGITGENVAERYAISRADMEELAVQSHQKAAAAQAAGKFDDEIIPVTVKTENGPLTLGSDEGIRPGTNAEALAALKPCFKADGLLTAGTSSQMTDGAAFMLLMSREKAQEMGIAPIAKFVAFASAGVAADIMGIGPVAAIPKVLAIAGLTLADMDTIELNEAFASQALVCIRELGLPPEKVNPNGGAMALGHPLGATGAVLLCKALGELKRTGGRYAMVTMCVGGGMGAAGIFEMEKT